MLTRVGLYFCVDFERVDINQVLRVNKELYLYDVCIYVFICMKEGCYRLRSRLAILKVKMIMQVSFKNYDWID